MATGRTSPRFTKFQIDDGTAMRDIFVKTFGNVGLTYDELDLSGLQELIKSFVSGQANFTLTITGPFDNRAVTTASASGQHAEDYISGSHTVLSAINGSNTARSFGVYFGIQGDWTTGDPVFGGIDTIVVTDYTVDPVTQMYSAKLAKAAAATNDPAWGTTAITA